MPKPIVAAVLVGMGWLLAYTPSAWKLVAYLIPAISVCLLMACIVKFLKIVGKSEP